MIYLDTHVVLWLYSGEVSLLPESVIRAIDGHELVISPMVLLELEYLAELDRLDENPATIISAMGEDIGLAVRDLPFHAIVKEAVQQGWTRDPFDRIITAQAILDRKELLTKDTTILANCDLARWDRE